MPPSFPGKPQTDRSRSTQYLDRDKSIQRLCCACPKPTPAKPPRCVIVIQFLRPQNLSLVMQSYKTVHSKPNPCPTSGQTVLLLMRVLLETNDVAHQAVAVVSIFLAKVPSLPSLYCHRTECSLPLSFAAAISVVRIIDALLMLSWL